MSAYLPSPYSSISIHSSCEWFATIFLCSLFYYLLDLYFTFYCILSQLVYCSIFIPLLTILTNSPHLSVSMVSIQNQRNFRLTSRVWNYFTYEEATDTSTCCAIDPNTQLQCRSRLKGRRNNNLQSHLKNKHPLDYAKLYNTASTVNNSQLVNIEKDPNLDKDYEPNSIISNYFKYIEATDTSLCQINNNGVICQFKVPGKTLRNLYNHLDKFHPLEYFNVKGTEVNYAEGEDMKSNILSNSFNYLNNLIIPPKQTHGRPCSSAVWGYFLYEKSNDRCKCLVVTDASTGETCSRFTSGKNPGNLKSHLRSVHHREYLIVMQADKLSRGDISSAESLQQELTMLDESGISYLDRRRGSCGGKPATSSLWNYFNYESVVDECNCKIYESGRQCDFRTPGKLHRILIAHLKSAHFDAYVDVRIAQRKNRDKKFKEALDDDAKVDDSYMELIESISGKKLLPPPPATEYLTADELTRYHRGRPRNTNVCQYFVYNGDLGISFCLLKNPANCMPCPIEISGRLSIRLLRHLKNFHPMEYVNATNSALNSALIQGIPNTSVISDYVIGLEEFISQVISKYYYFHEVVNRSVCIVDEGTGPCNTQIAGRSPALLFSHIHSAHTILYNNLNETRLNPIPSCESHSHSNDENLYDLCHQKAHICSRYFKYCAPIKRAICWLNDSAKDCRCCVRLDSDRTDDLLAHLKQYHPVEMNNIEEYIQDHPDLPKLQMGTYSSKSSHDDNSSTSSNDFEYQNVIENDVLSKNDISTKHDCDEPINLSTMNFDNDKLSTIGIWRFFKFLHHSNTSKCQLLNQTSTEPCTVEIPGRKTADILLHLKSFHPEQFNLLKGESPELTNESSNQTKTNLPLDQVVSRPLIQMPVFPDQADSLFGNDQDCEFLYAEMNDQGFTSTPCNDLKLVISRNVTPPSSTTKLTKKRESPPEQETNGCIKKPKIIMVSTEEPIQLFKNILNRYFIFSSDLKNATCCLLKIDSICGLQINSGKLPELLEHLKTDHSNVYFNDLLVKNPEIAEWIEDHSRKFPHKNTILQYFKHTEGQEIVTCLISGCHATVNYRSSVDLLMHLKMFHSIEYFLVLGTNNNKDPIEEESSFQESGNQDIRTVALAEFLMKAGLSIKMIEQNYFKEFLHAFDPHFKIPEILKLHEIQGKLLKISD